MSYEGYALCVRGQLTANAVNTNTKDNTLAARQFLIATASAAAIALLHLDDRSRGCGHYECKDREDILGEHVEFVLDG